MSSDTKPARRFGRFEIIEKLGSGAFGAVYRAVDTVLRREVALKVPLAASLRSEEARARFLREPKAAAQLRHPNIVPVFDAGHDGDLYYIAYAYIEGRTLERALATEQIDYRRAAQLVGALAEALDYAHRQQVIHRDVKPANVMLDIHGEPHLLDFGLARIESLGETVTQDGSLLGTPAFMSPEQAEGGNVGPPSDQYSLGVVLYQLLTGRLPFAGSPVQVLFQVRTEEPPQPSMHRPNVPRDLETICLKAMAKKPIDRYADCGALADDLRRWLDDEPLTARRTSLRERAVRWSRKNRPLAVLAAVVGALAIASTVAAVGFFAVYRRAEANFELAEANAHRAEIALKNYESEAKARRITEAALQRREADLLVKETELKTRDALLEEKDSALTMFAVDVARGKQELDQSQTALRRNSQELDQKKDELAKREEELKLAAVARDEALSESAWFVYVKNLESAQQALVGKDLPKALQYLDACPDSLRDVEWRLLRSVAEEKNYRWESKGPILKDQQGRDGYRSKIIAIAGNPQGTFVIVAFQEPLLANGFPSHVDSLAVLDFKTGMTIAHFQGIAQELGLQAPHWQITFSHDGSRAAVSANNKLILLSLASTQVTKTEIDLAVVRNPKATDFGGVFFTEDDNRVVVTPGMLLSGKRQTTKQAYFIDLATKGLVQSTSCSHDVHPYGSGSKNIPGSLYAYAPYDNPKSTELFYVSDHPAIFEHRTVRVVATLESHCLDNSYGLYDARLAIHPKDSVIVIGGGAAYRVSRQAAGPSATKIYQFPNVVCPVAFSSNGNRLAVKDSLQKQIIFYDSTFDGEPWRKVISLAPSLFPISTWLSIGGDLERVVTVFNENGLETITGWGSK